MPLTLLDIILLAVMLISAILALVRGFMREVLSIASWVAAAVLTYYAYPKLLPMAKQYVNHDLAASGVVIGGVFFGTLLIVSVITIKISDTILDSRVGALDRTLGFLFGLARGLLIVVVAFTFFDWLVPPKQQPKWVTEAKSWSMLDGTGKWLRAFSPDLEALWAKHKGQRREDPLETPPAETPPAEPATPAPPPARPRGASSGPSGAAQDEQRGYGRSDRVGMQQLLDGSAPKPR